MRLLIAGGGTGGHLFPAMAVARALMRLDADSSVLFVGTRHGIEARIVPQAGFPIRFITARGMRRTGLINKITAAFEIPFGMVQSISIIRQFRPGFVLGVGGYASGPTLAAAVLMMIPTAIQEQNSVMGTTNRILSHFVGKVFTSWENTDPPPPRSKTILAGNPVREDLFEQGDFKATKGKFKILVFGGSRGARSLNQALTSTIGDLGPYRQRISIMHQTGREEGNEVRQAYARAGIEAEVREFIDEMGSAYHWADLVVCRSGASSLAEITALGKPAIVVPYPYAIGDHQTRNARVLESAGALRMIPDSKLKNGALVAEIKELIEHPDILIQLARQSTRFGRPNAAQTIAQTILHGEGDKA